ncbi:hypothetical protein GWK47_015083 [Chionoecetes opilio]|uniref:ACAD9/ACADV-like C-terminal domain-containing protein n=1 Tax=Chionoecetes opilio TaxID=41210 RepID=A0A8J5CN39_CHIOP|nr:hypothetical protein GWK47_015083 [Chionoecetes opilio]
MKPSVFHPHLHYILINRSNPNNRRLQFAGDAYSYSPDMVTIAHAGPLILLAGTFCAEASERVKNAVNAMEKGPVVNNDRAYCLIADAIVENKGYVAEHPLTRTFW